MRAFIYALLLVAACLNPNYYRYSDMPVPSRYGAGQYRDLSDEEKKAFLTKHEGYSRSLARTIVKGKVQLGMTKEQVLYSWGRPNDINKSVGSWGVHEQWVYRVGSYSGQYLYFEDGELTSWQD